MKVVFVVLSIVSQHQSSTTAASCCTERKVRPAVVVSLDVGLPAAVTGSHAGQTTPSTPSAQHLIQFNNDHSKPLTRVRNCLVKGLAHLFDCLSASGRVLLEQASESQHDRVGGSVRYSLPEASRTVVLALGSQGGQIGRAKVHARVARRNRGNRGGCGSTVTP